MDIFKKISAGIAAFALSIGVASAQAFDPATSVTSVTDSVNTHLGYVVPLAIGLFGVVFLLRLIRRWMGKAGS